MLSINLTKGKPIRRKLLLFQAFVGLYTTTLHDKLLEVLKVAVTDTMYFARRKFSRS